MRSFGPTPVYFGSRSQGIDAFGDRIEAAPVVAAVEVTEAADIMVLPAEVSTAQTLGNTMLAEVEAPAVSEVR